LNVTARNVGRSQIEITGWSVKMVKKKHVLENLMSNPQSSLLPMTPDGGPAADFVMQLGPVLSETRRVGITSMRFHSHVTTATKGRVLVKRFTVPKTAVEVSAG
jgi:hypothetical protein